MLATEVVTQKIYENQVYSFVALQWVPDPDGTFWSIQPSGRVLKTPSFDLALEYESMKTPGPGYVPMDGNARFYFQHTLATNGTTNGEWLYATSFDSDIWYSVNTLNSSVRRRTFMRELIKPVTAQR